MPAVTMPASWSQMSWADRAACRSATPAESEQMTGATMQADTLALAERYCDRCPVLALCAAQGGEGRESGLWGGSVLAYGHPARPARAQRGPRPRRKAS